MSIGNAFNSHLGISQQNFVHPLKIFYRRRQWNCCRHSFSWDSYRIEFFHFDTKTTQTSLVQFNFLYLFYLFALMYYWRRPRTLLVVACGVADTDRKHYPFIYVIFCFFCAFSGCEIRHSIPNPNFIRLLCTRQFICPYAA